MNITKGYRKEGRLAECIFNPDSKPSSNSSENIFGLIVLERKANEKLLNQNYTLRDSLIIKLISKFVGEKICCLLAKYYSKETLERSFGILDAFKNITHETNLATIFKQITQSIPK